MTAPGARRRGPGSSSLGLGSGGVRAASSGGLAGGDLDALNKTLGDLSTWRITGACLRGVSPGRAAGCVCLPCPLAPLTVLSSSLLLLTLSPFSVSRANL